MGANKKFIGIEQLFTNNLPMFYYKKSRDGIYQECNPLFAYMAGYDCPDDIVGQTDADLPWKKLPTTILEAEKKALSSQIAHATGTFPIINGTQADVFITISPYVSIDDNNQAGTCGVGFNTSWINKAQSKDHAIAENVHLKRRRKQ